MSGIQQKNKLLVVHSSAGDDPANFRVQFHEPIIFPEHSQVRLINCRLNLDDNEVIVNSTNNQFQWCLGYGWSDEVIGSSSGFGMYTAKINDGSYRNDTGSGSDFITQAVEDALNRSVSNMSYLRGGFGVAVVAGALEIKLSKCTVPTIVNATPTLNQWSGLNQSSGVPGTNEIKFLNSRDDELLNKIQDLTGAGPLYNGVKCL